MLQCLLLCEIITRKHQFMLTCKSYNLRYYHKEGEELQLRSTVHTLIFLLSYPKKSVGPSGNHLPRCRERFRDLSISQMAEH